MTTSSATTNPNSATDMSPMSQTSQIVAINPANPRSAVIERAAELLKDHKLVVGPTETRYALLARADSDTALERLFTAKGRPAELLSAVFVRSVAEIKKIAIVNETAEKLIDRFLPGPLTLVLEISPSAAIQFGAGVTDQKTIGLRFSSCPFIAELLEALDSPLTATSANLSGEPEITSGVEIARVFQDRVSLCCDAGDLNAEVSTVVRVVGDALEILREGAISKEEITATTDTN